jgi:hypothetical protein
VSEFNPKHLTGVDREDYDYHMAVVRALRFGRENRLRAKHKPSESEAYHLRHARRIIDLASLTRKESP